MDGNCSVPFYLEESPSFPVEEIAQLLFDPDPRKTCTKQPIGCKTSATFVVDVEKLDHCDDIRADDLGVWINKGVRSNYLYISFTTSGKVKKVTNLGTRQPSVMRRSLYCLKRTYWKHDDDEEFSCRLFEIRGTLLCIVELYSTVDPH